MPEPPLPSLSSIDPDPIAEARLSTVVPEKASVVFDMHDVLNGVLDRGPRLELMPDYAPSVITMLARLDGRPVGIVANQPKARGGILDAKSSVKAARFINFCGRFGVPVLTFVDVPGFLPGTVEESRGVITHGATLLRAYAEADDVAKLTVIVRKAYGGAYIAMGSPSIGADRSWAWPASEVAVMGPGGAVGLLHRRALAEADDPTALRDELAAKYREEVASPYVAADAGIVDDVILPEETRARLVGALRVMSATFMTDSVPLPAPVVANVWQLRVAVGDVGGRRHRRGCAGVDEDGDPGRGTRRGHGRRPARARRDDRSGRRTGRRHRAVTPTGDGRLRRLECGVERDRHVPASALLIGHPALALSAAAWKRGVVDAFDLGANGEVDRRDLEPALRIGAQSHGGGDVQADRRATSLRDLIRERHRVTG